MTEWGSPTDVSPGTASATKMNDEVVDSLLNLKELLGGPFTNGNGSTLAQYDVVFYDIAASTIKHTTTIGRAGPIYVVDPVAGILNGQAGYVRKAGQFSIVKTTGVVAIGDRLQTSATAARAQVGALNSFGTALTASAGGNSTVLCELDKETRDHGHSGTGDGGALGAISVSDFTNMQHDHGDVNDGGPLVDPPGAFACNASHSVNQSIPNNAATAVVFDTDIFDYNDLHYTSSANLTGTVAKTATSDQLVGTGTSFTTELSVGQMISVPGTADEVRVVTAIADNTTLTVNRAFDNTASGQTAARWNKGLVARKAGIYAAFFHATLDYNAAGTRTVSFLRVFDSGATDEVLCTTGGAISFSHHTFQLSTEVNMAQWDYAMTKVYQDSGSALNLNTGAAGVGRLVIGLRWLSSA